MKKLICCVFIFGLIGVAQGATVSVNSPQPANTILSGPTSGGNDFPSFRSMVAADFTAGVINSAAIGTGAVVLTTKVTGVLPIANGGTNGATKQAGYDNLAPTAAKGDLAVFNGTNNVALNVGTNNFVLVADSTQATGLKWAAAGTGAAFSGLSGGTNTSAAMLIGTGASFGPTGTGTVTANQFVGTGSTTNAVDLATAEVAGLLTNNKGGTGADTSATGGAHNFVYQTSVGGAFTVAAAVEADLPATTAFTDVANTFSTVQTFGNYFSTQASTPATITTDTSSFDPGTVSYSRIASTAAWNVRGIINGVNGRRLTMINIGTSPIVFTHEDAAATASNRLHTPTGIAITLSVDYGVNFIYDSTDSRWRLIDIFQSSGGGGITIPSGTSGGIPYYSATSTITGSGLLSPNAIVLGGGSGSSPTTLGSLGTTSTLLHGNAAGAPTFGQIVTADITANNVDMATKMTGTMQAAQVPAFTGDVTTTAGSLATTIASTAVTAAKMVNSGVFTGDVTTTFPSIVIGTGAITTSKIGAAAVDLTTKVTGVLPIANGGSGQSTQQTAIDALAGSAAKGSVLVYNGTHWVQLPVGTDNSVLTALASSTNGATWGAAGGATVIAPLVISGGSVAVGTAIAATTSDVNADFLMGASATTKTVLKLQTKATNTAVAFEIQKSDGTIQYQLDNTTNSRNDITEKVQTANLSNIQMQSISENITIAAAATSTSATNLIPASSFIVAVTFRVTTVIPTASTFSVGIGGQTTLFGTGVSTVNGTTNSSMKQTIPLNPFTNASAAQVVITPNLTPGAATGTVRVTVWYFTCQEPQN